MFFSCDGDVVVYELPGDGEEVGDGGGGVFVLQQLFTNTSNRKKTSHV